MSKAKDKTQAPVLATRADIDAAIEALSAADEKRLDRIARYRFAALGHRAVGKNHEDLLHDAMLSLYEGADSPNEGRHWPKNKVAFVAFMSKAMQSIASHWAVSAEHEPMLDSELWPETDDGDSRGPLDLIPGSAPAQDRECIARERLESILKSLRDKGDDEAILIIEAWGLGMTGPEIIEQFGLTEERYEAGRKRIRYKVKA